MLSSGLGWVFAVGAVAGVHGLAQARAVRTVSPPPASPPASPPAPRPAWSRVLPWLAAWGPGLLVMLADTDAGNVVSAAQAGASWGSRLLPLLVLLIPLLYMVQ